MTLAFLPRCPVAPLVVVVQFPKGRAVRTAWRPRQAPGAGHSGGGRGGATAVEARRHPPGDDCLLEWLSALWLKIDIPGVGQARPRVALYVFVRVPTVRLQGRRLRVF